MSMGLTHIEARLYVASTVASALPATGITKANPGVVTCTGDEPTDGNFCVIQAEGMQQLDGRVIRANNPNSGAHTFELEGVDTTTFDTFTSGSVLEITAWTLVGEATDTLNFDNQKPAKIDRTRLSDYQERAIPGRRPSRMVSLDVLFVPGSTTALDLIQAAVNSRADLAFKLVLKSGEILLWNGIPFVGAPQFSTNQAIKRSLEVTLANIETDYAS